MGNVVSAIENGTSEIMQIASGFLHDVGNNPVKSTLAGAGVGGLVGAAWAKGWVTFCGVGLSASGLAVPIAVGAGIGFGIVGFISWYMQESNIDFRQALHQKKLDFLYDTLTQIKEMFDRGRNNQAEGGNAGNHRDAVQALQQIAAQYREFSELFHVFHLAIDANFRCVRCSQALEDILQICLCHTKKYPREMGRWTCHCLNQRHSCCALN